MNRNHDLVEFFQNIRTKCVNQRNDLMVNVDVLKNAIPTVADDPNGTRERLQDTFDIIHAKIEGMQSIIELWSPCHNCFDQFANGIVPIVMNGFHEISTEPLTPEKLLDFACQLEAMIEQYDECCFIIFYPFDLHSVWEWSAYPMLSICNFYAFGLIFIFIAVLLLHLWEIRKRKSRIPQEQKWNIPQK